MAENKTNDQFQLVRKPKNEFEILLTIPWSEIKKAQGKVVLEASQHLEIKGFRKGKAPEKLVKETLGPQRLLENTLQKVVPDYYQKAIADLQLQPILTPKVQLVSAKENEAWQVKFISCEEPTVNLGNYQGEIRKLKAPEQIWTPGKGAPPEKEKSEKDNKEEKVNRAIDWLLKNTKVEICDLLTEEEVTRRLAELVEQTQKLGLTIDQYLNSLGKTVEQIREEYTRSAQANMALEFILNRIADTEKISVTPEEIEKMIATAKTDEEKKSLETQRYLLATLVRRQKTLDFLASL
ncbi:MAG TPA: trigger factor [Patescibacteria group bacterium]|nr:trigger factor [Patescibacteria group bacterium]